MGLDEMFHFAGQLTLIGCSVINNREWDVTIPVFVCEGITASAPGTASSSPNGLTLINTTLYFVNNSNLGSFIKRSSGDPYNVLNDSNARLVMLNCLGTTPGSNTRLPNIIPANTLWQGTATYDPASLAAGAVGTIQTLAVPGALLGDLVEASFSLDLQGVGINAWVSAADTVKYQFRNPTAAPIDLGSGTVKCRVKK